MIVGEQNSLLIEQAKNGNELAKEELLTINSPLIKSVVKRYLGKGVEYDDLYQLGAMGFIKAINNYDASFNVKFTTYAVPMIAGEIKRFLRDDGSIKVSRSIKHNAIKIKNYIYEYNKKYGTNPSLDHLSNQFNIDKNELIFTMEANTLPLSINEKINENEDSCTILDRLTDNFSPDNYFDKLSVRDMINNLTAREKQVIILRYYFDKTQSEIAKELGVSQVQVSRIENKVLKEMKNDFSI